LEPASLLKLRLLRAGILHAAFKRHLGDTLEKFKVSQRGAGEVTGDLLKIDMSKWRVKKRLYQPAPSVEIL
jgi:hypothetical protein